MTEKQCSSCGEVNTGESNFCSNCGSGKFKDIPLRLAARLGSEARRQASDPQAHASPGVRLLTGRVVVLSALTAGLYVFYWFYLTWKQLAAETGEDHHPVWHALTLFVPFYNLFRMHAHVRVIGEVAATQHVTTTMAPGLAVVLLVVSNVVGWSALNIDDTGVLILLTLIGTALNATLVATAQSGLNRYWEVRWAGTLHNAPIGVGEFIFVVLGILVWSGDIFG